MTRRKRGRGFELPPPMPVEELRELFGYDPATGLLSWKIPGKGRRGDSVGCVNSRGYIVVRVNGVIYPAHRLIWFMMTGQWPMEGIDHMDTNEGNNRWGNLRVATHQQNGRNVAGRASSGQKGVYPTASGKWMARLKIDGKIINCPSRETVEEARADYVALAEQHHGEFMRTD